MNGNQPASPIGCRWCGQRLDATHAAGDCLQRLDRDLETSLETSRRRERSIEARLRALDSYMDQDAPKNTR
jgi:hypothetical protein